VDDILKLKAENYELSQEIERLKQASEIMAGFGERAFTAGVKQMKEIAELRQQLEASQRLSEERRVALAKCSPFNAGYCKFCRIDRLTEEHKPNCDYCQLIKEDE